MTHPLKLQAGGTLNPGRHLYITRPEDDRLLELLLAREYVNVLTSRQMGKSSMMMYAVGRLAEQGVRFVSIDLAGEMGTPDNVEIFYIGLLSRIARDLHLTIDLMAWWPACAEETFNQRLLRFFREVVGQQVTAPLVIFLDEIDSTLKLPFTDDLFTAMRSIYNERTLVPAYERITFCLLGVASANELIKDRRTTPYNVGETFELSDFDAAREDVSELGAALNDDPQRAASLLERVLYWTGGHPYLTTRLCLDLRAAGASTPAEVDRYVETTFVSIDRVRSDAHVAQTLRFVETRLTSGRAALRLYARILRGARERDVPAISHNELKLSGLVKRDGKGCLVVRNPIYRKLFDLKWVESMRGMRESRVYRFVAIGCLFSTMLMGFFVWIKTAEPLEPMTSVTFSTDGRRLATASWGGGARIWDAESGKELVSLQGNFDKVNSVAFSPDGHRLATASWDGARIWDAESGKELVKLEGSGMVNSVAFSPDGRRLATGSYDKTVGVWDAESGKELVSPKGHLGSVNSVAFSPDGQRLATGSDDGTARVWDAGSGTELVSLQGNFDMVNSVAFSPDGHRLATASWDGARIWDAESGKELVKLKGSGMVNSVAFSPDGRRLATGSYDKTVGVWDAESGKELVSLAGHWGSVNSVAFSPDGRLATGSNDGTARVWDIASGTLRQRIPGSWIALLAISLPAEKVILVFLVVVLFADFIVIRNVADSSMSATSKTVWSMIVTLLPMFGILLWLVFVRARPGRAPAPARP